MSTMPITDGLLSMPDYDDYDDTIEVRTLAGIVKDARTRLAVAILAELERRLPELDRWRVADISEEIETILEEELDCVVEEYAEAWIE